MDKDLAAIMGQAARRARQARQLTQEQVAAQLGISSEFYSRLERGQAHPSLETLLRMADVLGVNIDTLLGLDAGPAGAPAAFSLVSPDDPPAVRRLAVGLQASQPSTIRLMRAILAELEELEAARRRARRALGEGDATPDESAASDAEAESDGASPGEARAAPAATPEDE